MSDAAGEASNGLHFVGLAETVFQLLLFGLSGVEVAAHAVEGNGHFADFILACGSQWKIEVAFGQRANACDQTGQRLGESM